MSHKESRKEVFDPQQPHFYVEESFFGNGLVGKVTFIQYINIRRARHESYADPGVPYRRGC